MTDFPIIPGGAFTSDQIAMLDEPLNAQLLKERQGAGNVKLKYLDGRTAIETANRIFGKGKWGFRITSRSHEKIQKANGEAQEYFTADIELYVAGNPFPFPGDGIGGVKSNTVEGIEMARKDAVTDALKRALCYYGDQFGLALRDKDGEPLVEIAEGVMVHVNEVQINKNGANTVKPSAAARMNAAPVRQQIAAPSNVVDSQPPQENFRPAGATDQAFMRMIAKCDEIAGKGKGQGAYQRIRKHVAGDLPDDKITDQHLTEMWTMINAAGKKPLAKVS
jgi:hypothetical protein